MWSNHAASFAHYGNLHGTLAGADLIKIDEIKAPERPSRSNAPSIKAMFIERRPCIAHSRAPGNRLSQSVGATMISMPVVLSASQISSPGRLSVTTVFTDGVSV